MILFFNQYFKDENIIPTMPIGLLSLASYMKSQGVNCHIWDLQASHPGGCLNMEAIELLFIFYKPIIVGISASWTPHFAEVLEIAKFVKEFDKKIVTVVGGNHASSLTGDYENIDYIIQGEGELNFYDLYQEIVSAH
jgi:radical SAM superfamily enzyme YgiQ (UPF0313 family)